MRGHDILQTSLFSFVDMGKRIPTQHPLRKIRILVDRGLVTLEPLLSAMYSDVGRVSIAPEKLIRALLIQILALPTTQWVCSNGARGYPAST